MNTVLNTFWECILNTVWWKMISNLCKMDKFNFYYHVPFKKCFIKSITPQGPSFLYILFGSRIKHITHMDCTLDSCTQLHYFLWEYWIWIFFLDGGDSFLILCHLAFSAIILEILQPTEVKHFHTTFNEKKVHQKRGPKCHYSFRIQMPLIGSPTL